MNVFARMQSLHQTRHEGLIRMMGAKIEGAGVIFLAKQGFNRIGLPGSAIEDCTKRGIEFSIVAVGGGVLHVATEFGDGYLMIE